MALSILSNEASLTAQRNLEQTNKALTRSYERLSSGLRIVRASDDPAGLALADKLRAESLIASQAIRNANDGISLISIADGALTETSALLMRMGELAEQAANGILSNDQRSSLQSEFIALGSEIHRISQDTEYNNINLLSNAADISIQVGFDGGASSKITIAAVSGTLTTLGLASGATAQMSYSLLAASGTLAQVSATSALEAVKTAISTVSLARGSLGAAESRLTAALNNLQVLRENLTSAESQIRDVDIAFEAAELVKYQIRQQSATSVLAQANQQPALALTLLGG